MNYQDMISKATLYQEAEKTLNQKPQLIRAAQGNIYRLEREISELEEKAMKAAMNESMNKMNPLRFFAKKEEDYDTKITELEADIKKEQRKIDGLGNTKTEEYINLEAVTEEALRIMGEQSKVIAAHKKKVLDAQADYHNAIEEYQDELSNQKSFVMKVRGLEESIKKESFTPTYNREMPYINSRLNSESFSPEIITNHLQRPNLKNTLHS